MPVKKGIDEQSLAETLFFYDGLDKVYWYQINILKKNIKLKNLKDLGAKGTIFQKETLMISANFSQTKQGRPR